MSNDSLNKPPIWFWIVSVLALIWNVLGVGAYFAQTSMTPEMMEALPQSDQDMYANLPSWYMIAFAIAVFAATLGCIALLLRKKWAYFLLILSAIGVLAQQYYIFSTVKPDSIIMPIMIIIVSIALVFFSKKAIENRWIA